MGKTSKDKRDIYYRKAKEDGWRARSAYKLLHLHDQYDLFRSVHRAVDLCAAPGSWSQVLSKKLPAGSTVVAVDLQPMAPLPGVMQLQGDITQVATAKAVIDAMGGELADLVVCDGAPDVTGLHEMDEFVQSQLLFAALHITLHVLRRGGTFVAKFFRGFGAELVYQQMAVLFDHVQFCKPASSRASSFECFIVARGLNVPEGLVPGALTAFIEGGYCREAVKEYGRVAWELVPFLATGDVSGFDSETNYELPEGHVVSPPVQPPTAPPYLNAVLEKRGMTVDEKDIKDV